MSANQTILISAAQNAYIGDNQFAMSTVHALLVDDHPLFIAGIGELLRTIRPEIEIESAPDGAQARAKLLDRHFDLVVLDLELPDVTGHELVQEALHANPSARTVVISGSTRLMDVHRALMAGADGYISKSLPTEELRAALTSMLAGSRVVPRGYSEERIAVLTELTQRQLDVLKLLDQGLTNQRIADRLSISTDTVKSHLRVLFGALNVNSRAGCISSARDLGLI